MIKPDIITEEQEEYLDIATGKIIDRRTGRELLWEPAGFNWSKKSKEAHDKAIKETIEALEEMRRK